MSCHVHAEHGLFGDAQLGALAPALFWQAAQLRKQIMEYMQLTRRTIEGEDPFVVPA